MLPRIRHLRLNNFFGSEDLSKTPVLFPGVRSVVIRLAPDVTDIPETVLEIFPNVPVISTEKTDSVI